MRTLAAARFRGKEAMVRNEVEKNGKALSQGLCGPVRSLDFTLRATGSHVGFLIGKDMVRFTLPEVPLGFFWKFLWDGVQRSILQRNGLQEGMKEGWSSEAGEKIELIGGLGQSRGTQKRWWKLYHLVLTLYLVRPYPFAL